MELTTGSVKGALLVFGAVVNGWAAIVMDGLSEKAFGGEFAESTVVMQVADDLAAEAPEVVDVAADGFRGKTRCGQVFDEAAKQR